MNKKLKLFALSAVLFSGAAQAVVVDFEGGNASPYFATDNLEVVYIDTTDTSSAPAGSGYANVAAYTSGSWVATNRNQYTPATFTYIGDVFTLNSLVISAAWGSDNVTFTGYKDGQQLFTSGEIGISLAATEVTFGWEGIDQFAITLGSRDDYVPDPVLFAGGNNGQFWALGSMTVNQPVPEPETYAMLLAGLAIGGAVARRRRETGRV